MNPLLRFGVSMDAELLSAFDHMIQVKGYANRSEALRDLVRESLLQDVWSDGKSQSTATLCLVGSRSAANARSTMDDTFSSGEVRLISSLQVDLPGGDVLEVAVLEGAADSLRLLAAQARARQGVKLGRLVPIEAERSHSDD